MNRTAVALIVLVVIAGAVLRVLAAAGTDFWFDEIWSLDFAVRHPEWWRVFSIHHDNNHLLNTLWLHFTADADVWLLYRLPSLLGGIAAVGLLAYLGARHGAPHAVFCAVLSAGSYLLIHYSSEARGYGPAVFFGLLNLVAVERYLERRRLRDAVLVWLCVSLGLLSHYTFLFPAIGAGAWSLLRLWRLERGAQGVVEHALRMHAVPVLFVGLLYFAIVREMKIGGGPIFPPGEVLKDTLVSTFGVGSWEGWQVGVALAAIGVALPLELFLRWRERDPRWPVFVLVIALTPLIVFGILRPKILYVRYFLVCVPFLLLLAGTLLGRLWSSGIAGRVAAVAVTGIILAENGDRIAHLLGGGRGHYLEAVRHMASHTPARDILVSFPIEDRNRSGRVLEYYRRFLPPGRTLGPDLTGGARAHWYLLSSWDPAFVRPEIYRSPSGNRFALDAVFPNASISGWTWYLYRAAGS